ncbi:MAG: ABC transporter substrate-binding protein [Actinomycetota bacterium]
MCLLTLALALSACGPRFRLSALPTAQGPAGPGGGQTSTAIASGVPSISGSVGFLPGSTDVHVSGGSGGVVRGGVIKIGGLFPLTGGLASLGVPAFQGAQAEFNYINAHGGILGRQVQFIPCDDQADDTKSTTCAKKLVEQDGIFAMGPSFTPFSLSVINQLQQAGVPWIGYDGINVEGFSANNVVTIGASIETMAHGLFPYWYNQFTKEHGHAPQRIGAIVLDSGPAQTYLREVNDVICPKLGCTILPNSQGAQVSYQTTDYETICHDMQAQSVDAIWLVTDPASAIKALVGCQAVGIDPKQTPFLGQHGIFLDLTLRQAGKYSDGIYANSALLPSDVSTPATQLMQSVIHTYYPDAELGYFTELSYGSARLFADVITRALQAGGDLTRDKALKAASQITSYDCNGLCKDVNLAPPVSRSGGNHNIWIVKSDFSSGQGRWVEQAGPIDAFNVSTWPCPGKPRPC